MASGKNSPMKKSPVSSELDLRPSKSIPLKTINKIVGNYTKRNNSKHIQSKNISTISELTEENNSTPRQNLEILNHLRLSPPKAEIFLGGEREDCDELKRIIREERLKYVLLDENYKELLNHYTQNEVRYKKTVLELEEKLAKLENPNFVTREEFLELASRVGQLEAKSVRKLK